MAKRKKALGNKTSKKQKKKKCWFDKIRFDSKKKRERIAYTKRLMFAAQEQIVNETRKITSCKFFQQRVGGGLCLLHSINNILLMTKKHEKEIMWKNKKMNAAWISVDMVEKIRKAWKETAKGKEMKEKGGGPKGFWIRDEFCIQAALQKGYRVTRDRRRVKNKEGVVNSLEEQKALGALLIYEGYMIKKAYTQQYVHCVALVNGMVFDCDLNGFYSVDSFAYWCSVRKVYYILQ